MKKKIDEKREEILSRREFFKNASRAVLPIIAAITLTNPIAAIAAEEEPKQCDFGCTNGCSGSCGRSCSYSCSGSCSGSCIGSCKGNCSRACSYGCKNGSYM